jgi:hypothetical protein
MFIRDLMSSLTEPDRRTLLRLIDAENVVAGATQPTVEFILATRNVGYVTSKSSLARSP